MLSYSRYFMLCCLVKQVMNSSIIDLVQELDLSPTDKVVVHLSNLYGVIQPGDHIAVPIATSEMSPGPLRPWHHGIYAGNKCVIHMHGDNKASARICQDSLETFCGAASHVAIIQYSSKANGEDCGKDEALSLARELLHSNAGETYNLLSNNCEHFATYCRLGRCVGIEPLNTSLSHKYNHTVQQRSPKNIVRFLLSGCRRTKLPLS